MNDDEKEKNYYRLINTIEYLKNDGHISEDWMEEHKSYIQYYRKIIPDYNSINIETTDKTFRECAYKVEIILRVLIKEIKARNYFNTKMYLELNQKILYMIDYLDNNGIDELTNELLKLSM